MLESLSLATIKAMDYLAVTIILVVLCALAVFQIFLAAGAPYGNLAWGGQHKILPKKLRIASGLSVILYSIFGLIALMAAGVVDTGLSESAQKLAVLFVTVYSIAGIFLNAISRSKYERLVMTPIVTVLAICYGYLLMGVW